jgi:hypothetical protein
VPRYGRLEHFAGDARDGVLQRPAPRSTTTSSRQSGWRSPPRSGWPSSAPNGASEESSSRHESASKWGYATLGRIGFEGRYDYGAVGPVTNLASRLSAHAAAGQILIGQRVFAAVMDMPWGHSSFLSTSSSLP